MGRKILLKENDQIEKCPKCGNNTVFNAHSCQTSEDSCDVWVVCKCGFDPTEDGKGALYRHEDVWGGTSNENVLMALDVWNDLVSEMDLNQTKS